MANEFVARRGIIAQSGGAQVTGSLLVSGAVNATGYRVTATEFAGSLTGSVLGTATTASYVTFANVDNKPTLVSASSQIDYNQIQNKLSGVVSSSTQVQPLLPAGTVSSSAQFKTLTDPFTGSFTGSFTGDGSNLTNIATILSLSGSATGVPNSSGSLNLRTQGLIVSASNGITAVISGQTLTISTSGSISSSTQIISSLPAGVVSSSTQFKTLTDPFTGSFTGSFKGDGSGLININQGLLPAGTISSSTQVDFTQIQNTSGVVSSSTQFKTLTDPFTGSFTGSFAGTHTGTFPYSGLTGTPTLVSASSQIDYNQIQNKLSGVYSSSTQVVTAIAGQTIAPSTVNATGIISGASIQVSGNGTIGGNLTVTGTITATSQSIQYVSSSQLNVSTNKIIVNTDNSLRFGGISVVDSGSIGKSGSLFWDSLTDRWVYEDVSGGVYNSAILIAGPQNVGTTGNERGLLAGRVPVASGDDHIDTAVASSSIRVDFPSRLTHIEAGLFITGALTANGTVTLQGIPSSSTQVKTLLPVGTVTSSAQFPGWVTASSQVVYTSLQSIPVGIVSSSTQVQTLLPGGTVSSSVQYPGWVTSSAQINFTQIQNTAGIISSSTQFRTITNPFTGSFTGSFAGTYTGTLPYSSLTGIPANIVSSSTQVQSLLPGGTVSASSQYPGWVTASSQIQLSGITGTTFAAANFTFPQQLTVTGVLSGSTSAHLTNTLYSGSTVTGIVGPVNNQVIATLQTGSFNSAHFDYIVNDGTNYRTGTVMSVWSAGSVEFTETSTTDLGNTTQATFTVDVLSGIARLRFSNVSGTWTVRTAIRAL